jgi:hypothetical protein
VEGRVAAEAQLAEPGRLNRMIEDPDGNYSHVRYRVRHESGHHVVPGVSTIITLP